MGRIGGKLVTVVGALVLVIALVAGCRTGRVYEEAGSAETVARLHGERADRIVLRDGHLFVLAGSTVRCYLTSDGSLEWEVSVPLEERESMTEGYLLPPAPGQPVPAGLLLELDRTEWIWHQGKTDATWRTRILFVTDGTVAWTRGPMYSGGGSLTGDARVAVLCGSREPFGELRTVVVDAVTGRELWQRPGGGRLATLQGEECLYFYTSRAEPAGEVTRLTVVDLEGREIAVASWRATERGSQRVPPSQIKRVTVVARDGNHVRLRGRMLERCTATGEVVWSRDLPPGPDDYLLEVLPTRAAVAGGHVGGAGYLLVAYDLEGNRIWSSGDLRGKYWKWGTLGSGEVWWSAVDPRTGSRSLAIKGLTPDTLARPARLWELGPVGWLHGLSADGAYAVCSSDEENVILRLPGR